MDKSKSFGNRSRLYYALGLLLVLIISFLLGEILVRVTKIGSPDYLILFDKSLVKGRPFAKYANRKENLNLVRLNNWGFHDRNRDIDNDRYRILFLGDSIVEGVQVPVERLFTSLLEDKFRQGGDAVEVINGGVSGCGTAYQYLLWKKFFADRIRIDHIVACVFIENDLENNNSLSFYVPDSYMVYLDALGNVYTKLPRYPLFQSAVKGLARYSALVNTIYKRLYILKRSYLERKMRGAPTARYENQTGRSKIREFPGSAWDDSINGTLRLIERWNQELSSRGIGFSLVLINSPYFYIRGGYENEFEESFVIKLEKLCLRDEIPLLKLDFTDYDPFDIYSFDRVSLGHFNYLGHRLAAEQLFLWLKKFI